MQQSYFGSVEAINDPRNVELIRIRTPQQLCSPKVLLQQKKTASFTTLQQLKLQAEDSININVSGKCFAISNADLAKYPNSLLSDEEKRLAFYDSKRKEYFFDHNRLIAQSICLFYQYGCLQLPDNFPEYLIFEELNFYGLLEYLDEDMQKNFCDFVPLTENDSAKDIREKLRIMLESPDGVGVNNCARCYNLFSLSTIIFSIFLLCFASYFGGNFQNSSMTKFDDIAINWILLSEIVCIGFFSMELFLRFIVSYDKRRFFFSFLNIIDLVAIAPFYIGIILDVQHITTPLTVLRVLRIGKVFRVLKISRYNTSLLIIARTLMSGRWDLWMLLFLLLILCLFYGSVTYYMEEIFAGDETKFDSIPSAIWWALITSLAIGYGAMVPQSSAGRLAGALCAVSGVVVVAPILPIIFNRWSRFNRLQQEAKLRQKCTKVKNKNIHQEVEHLNLIRVHGDRKRGRFFF